MTLYYSLVSARCSSTRRTKTEGNQPGLSPPRLRDGRLRRPDRTATLHHQTQAVYLHIRESSGGETAVRNKGPASLHRRE